MRTLLDGHPIRMSLVIVAITSIAATAVILTGASGRTPAQKAALVALREPVTARTVKVVAAAVPPATTAAAAPSVAPSGSGTGGSAGAADTGGGGSSAADSGGDTGGGGSVAGVAVGGGDITGGDESTGGDDTTGGGDPTSGGDTTGSGSGGGGSSASDPASSTVPAGDADLPKVGHVFEIGLSTTSYKAAFVAKTATYLRSLTHKGTVLSGYHSLGSSELADELASVSGQVPDSDTRAGCMKFSEFKTGAVANAKGFVPGNGCVYPETALTIGDQVTSSGHTWGAYVADQGTKEACIHPNSNAVDDVALPFSDPGYEDRHNPFVYFHSLLDLGDCSTDDVDLTKLSAALRSVAKTPTFTYVAPDACADARAVATSPSTTTGTTPTPGTPTTTGSSTTTPGASTTTPGASTTTPGTPAITPGTSAPTPGTTTTTTTTTTTSTTASTTTTTPTGTTGTGSSTTPAPTISGPLGLPTAAACPSGPVGIAAEDAFLKTWVPQILHSGAYRKDGVLVIAFSGDGIKASGPAVKTGALVLSRWTKGGAKVSAPYTPYSLLRSVEDMLRYQRLAEASTAKSFAAAVFPKLH
jgi:hypothetical protein